MVNKKGVISAFQRAKQQGLSGEVIRHLRKHYEELGLSTENFEEGGDSLDKEEIKMEEQVEMSANSNVDPNAMADTLIDEAKQNEEKSEEYEVETNMSTEESELRGVGMAENTDESSKEESDDEEKEEEAEKEDFAMLYAKLKEEHTVMMAELDSLRQFKLEYDSMQQKMAVEETMAYVAEKSDMPEEKMSELREKGMGCHFSELSAWANEAKAIALDFAKNDKRESSYIKIGLNYTTEKTTDIPNDSVWGKL